MVAEKRVATGIPRFDAMIGGGFEIHSINLVAGGSGSGKSIFAVEYLLEGLKKGESVLYVTFEEKKEDFYENMKHLGWDLEKAEKTGKFLFLEYSPEKVKMMLDEGGGAIESTVYKNKVSRMVIDSVTSFALLFDDEQSRRQSVLGLFDIIRKWDCTTLLTVQHNPTNAKDRGLSYVEFEADSIILLYLASTGSQRRRYIEVLKMRGTRHSKELHIFKIDKGIIVGPISTLKDIPV
jgi:circadian clock protein KaiC